MAPEAEAVLLGRGEEARASAGRPLLQGAGKRGAPGPALPLRAPATSTPPSRRTSRGSWPSWCPRTWTRACSSPTRRGPLSPDAFKPSWSGASLSGTTWLWRPRPRVPPSRADSAQRSVFRCLSCGCWGRQALRPPVTLQAAATSGIRKQAWGRLAGPCSVWPWRSPLVGVTGTSPASKRPPGRVRGQGVALQDGPGLPARGCPSPQGLPPQDQQRWVAWEGVRLQQLPSGLLHTDSCRQPRWKGSELGAPGPEGDWAPACPLTGYSP